MRWLACRSAWVFHFYSWLVLCFPTLVAVINVLRPGQEKCPTKAMTASSSSENICRRAFQKTGKVENQSASADELVTENNPSPNLAGEARRDYREQYIREGEDPQFEQPSILSDDERSFPAENPFVSMSISEIKSSFFSPSSSWLPNETISSQSDSTTELLPPTHPSGSILVRAYSEQVQTKKVHWLVDHLDLLARCSDQQQQQQRRQRIWILIHTFLDHEHQTLYKLFTLFVKEKTRVMINIIIILTFPPSSLSLMCTSVLQHQTTILGDRGNYPSTRRALRHCKNCPPVVERRRSCRTTEEWGDPPSIVLRRSAEASKWCETRSVEKKKKSTVDVSKTATDRWRENEIDAITRKESGRERNASLNCDEKLFRRRRRVSTNADVSDERLSLETREQIETERRGKTRI